jgi:hypothetical protein
MASDSLKQDCVGGVNVYQRHILTTESKQHILQRALGLVLLILVTGIWACLWVPPLG